MNTDAHSTWLEINLGAIKHNVQLIKKMTGTEVMAVVKANAYGHGVLEVAKAVTEAGAAWCGLARMEEALNLRSAGVDANIMVLGYTPSVLIPEAIKNDIHVAVYDPDMARAYSAYARASSGQLQAHIKVETGMGRLGMAPELVPNLLAEYRDNPTIEFDGIFTHFARADEPLAHSVESQLRIFTALLAQLKKADLCPRTVHAANSAAILNFPSTFFDLVRPGIATFGLDPSPESRLPETFKPALSWKARLTSVRVLPPGHGVSYGSIYVTSQDERIGVIPVGYGDGYRRVAGQKAIVRGKIVNVVGRVCMDQSMLQLDSVPDAVPGDEVILIGEQAGEKITVGDLAQRWRTLNYEVVCGLADRLPRIYLEE